MRVAIVPSALFASSSGGISCYGDQNTRVTVEMAATVTRHPTNVLYLLSDHPFVGRLVPTSVVLVTLAYTKLQNNPQR